MCWFRYAYSEGVDDELDEEAQSLTKHSEGNFGLVNMEKRDKNAADTSVYGLEDGQEEDKREWWSTIYSISSVRFLSNFLPEKQL